MAVFGGRRRDDNPALPPGQHLTESFPVLSAGPTPRRRRPLQEGVGYGLALEGISAFDLPNQGNG
jgi:hypothetical protein